MATRPTNAPGTPGPFIQRRNLGNGCIIELEFVPHGTGLISSTVPISPITEIEVNDEGHVTLDLEFDLLFKCSKDEFNNDKKCKHPGGCTGELTLKLEMTVDIDFLLPEDTEANKRRKEGFKDCLDSFFTPDAICLKDYQNYLKRVDLDNVLEDLIDIMSDLAGGLQKGEDGHWKKPTLDPSVVGGMEKAVYAILDPAMSYWDEGWEFADICSCGNVDKIIEEIAIASIKEKVEEEKPKWENIIREHLYAEQQALIAGNNDPMNNIKSRDELIRQFESEGPRNLT